MIEEEKQLVLATLLHDIGKFWQRVEGNQRVGNHQKAGKEVVSSMIGLDLFGQFFEKKESVEEIAEIVKNHHSPNSFLGKIVQAADHISAGERVDFETKKIDEKEVKDWGHKSLSSVFSKVQLSPNKKEIKPKYFRQSVKKISNVLDVNELIANEETPNYFANEEFQHFVKDCKSLLLEIETFDDFIRYLLLILDRYTSYIPDFTGSSYTDISLFLHLKISAAFAHAIYRSDVKGFSLSKLKDVKFRLLTGELPSVQKYIFNIDDKSAAKRLRARSISTQVYSRISADLVLDEVDLTEASLIMHTGDKFFILVSDKDYEKYFDDLQVQIERKFFDRFKGDLQFVLGASDPFNIDLPAKNSDEKIKFQFTDGESLTFGDVISNTLFNLSNNRKQIFSSILRDSDGNFNSENFVLEDVVSGEEKQDSNALKCELCKKPKALLNEISDMDEKICPRCKLELEIGQKVLHDEPLTLFTDLENLEINLDADQSASSSSVRKIIINPDIKNLSQVIKNNSSYLSNASYLWIASHAATFGDFGSEENKTQVMDFASMVDVVEKGELSSKPNSANKSGFLAVIRGDIDNLGLIFSEGFKRDGRENLDTPARNIMLSRLVKTYFSDYLDAFLKKYQTENDLPIYTMYAGGDDLFLLTHFSKATELIDRLNKDFNDFVCDNEEIHISWSVTLMKPHVPIRLVAELSEENQSLAKMYVRNSGEIDKNTFDFFVRENNKSSVYILGDTFKNSELDRFNQISEDFYEWRNNYGTKNPALSSGLLRALMEAAKRKNIYESSLKSLQSVDLTDIERKECLRDMKNLNWHYSLSYRVEREFNSKKKRSNRLVYDFCEEVLSLLNDDENSLNDYIESVLKFSILKIRHGKN